MGHEYYNTRNFPIFVCHHGNWDIYRNDKDYCAAIPIDGSGCQASHFGDMHYLRVVLPRRFGINLLEPS